MKISVFFGQYAIFPPILSGCLRAYACVSLDRYNFLVININAVSFYLMPIHAFVYVALLISIYNFLGELVFGVCS